jgi:5-methylcytosine-specific restriction endonuclease McrA
MRPFKNFQLSAHSDVPESIRANYKLPGNPWGDGVQDYHRSKLPLLKMNGAKAVPCAYCRNPITRFNSEIDHVVAVKQYARYRAYTASPLPGTDVEVKRLCEDAHSDSQNLLLACVPCNQDKKFKVFAPSELKKYAAAFYKFTEVKNKAYQKFFTAGQVIALMGAHKESNAILNDLAVRGERATGVSEFARTVQRITIDLFLKGRPAFTVTWEALAHEQGWIDYDFSGRACPYCLGIYHSGFELDHIRAKVGMTPTLQHNNPENLVMCCASCNSSKGTYFLSKSFINRRIKERRDEGIPGVELFDLSPDLADTRADIDRIFGL